MKEYIMELAEAKGVDFEEITNKDIEMDLMEKAQAVFMNFDSTQDELNQWKEYLPVKPYADVKFYDAEVGKPKFKIGDVIMSNGACYLIK